MSGSRGWYAVEVEYVHMWLFISGPTANWLQLLLYLEMRSKGESGRGEEGGRRGNKDRVW